MAPKTKIDETLELVRELGVVRPRDLDSRSIPHEYLRRLVKRGLLDHSARGLYRLADSTVTEHHSLAEASKRVPQGIVCLLSALRFHDLWRYGRICRVANIMRPYLESLETLA